MAVRRSRWEDSRSFHGAEEDEEGGSSPEAAEAEEQDEGVSRAEKQGQRAPESTGSPGPCEGDGSSEAGEQGPGGAAAGEQGGGALEQEPEGAPSGGAAEEPSPGASQAGVQGPGSAEGPGVSQAGEQGPGVNLFANDGSFLELFKRKMEAAQEPEQPPEQEPERKRSALSGFVGKRRGGTKLALKTGVVAKKQKADDEISSRGGAWAQYMAEVKKYKAHQCSDDDKTRPLVK